MSATGGEIRASKETLCLPLTETDSIKPEDKFVSRATFREAVSAWRMTGRPIPANLIPGYKSPPNSSRFASCELKGEGTKNTESILIIISILFLLCIIVYILTTF